MPDGLLLYNNIDYSLLRRNRIDGNRGGGVCAFIRNVFSFTQVNIPPEFDLHEILCFDVLIDNLKLRFIYVYRPPNASKQIRESLLCCLDSLCDIDYVLLFAQTLTYQILALQLNAICQFCPALSHILPVFYW